MSVLDGLINSHTLSQCKNSSSFNEVYRDVENVDVSGRHGSMSIHTLYPYNGLSSLINLNNNDDIEKNGYLNNGDVGCGNGFINSHTLYKFN